VITDIKNDTDSSSLIATNEINRIDTLNIFVGSNNSGKSYLIRSLFEYKLDVIINTFNSKIIEKYIIDLKSELNTYLKHFEKSSYIKSHQGRVNNINYNKFSTEGSNQNGLKSTLEGITSNNINILSDGSVNVKEVINSSIGLAEKHIPYINAELETFNPNDLIFTKHYIPILRGLIPIQYEGSKFNLNTNNYQERVLKDFFKTVKLKETHFIYTGLDLYNIIVNKLLGDTKDREQVKDFENFLSSTFFDNQHINLVPKVNTDVLSIKIGDEEKPIYQLGDGIQTIILIMYPVFFAGHGNHLFFIEEPETHLHPGMQRILIETLLLPRFSTYQYYITTHSNHFLDLSLEYDNISIYAVTKEKQNNETKIKIDNINQNHLQVLNLLGVRNSSIFLSSCTIWVEGITDRLYIRKFLELIFKINNLNFKEDMHYSFIEYSGNNITHWSFLESDDKNYFNINYKSITNKIFLIADKDGVDIIVDRKKTKKALRQKQLKQNLGEHFYLTKGYEIENLLSIDIIKKSIETINKNTNINFEDFDMNYKNDEQLSLQITKHIMGIKKFNKLEFCKTAISLMTSNNHMTKEANTLTSKILNFISECN
jgi:predicted ATPase